MGTQDGPRISRMERHFQSIIATLLLGIAGWIAITTTETSKGQAAIAEQIGAARSELARLSSEVRSITERAYLKEDARREFDRVDRILSEVDSRIREIEARGARR